MSDRISIHYNNPTNYLRALEDINNSWLSDRSNHLRSSLLYWLNPVLPVFSSWHW